MRILLVQEEVHTAQYLRKGLTENGFTVDVVRFDSGGFSPPQRAEYDLLVCDVPRGAAGGSDFRLDRRHAPVLFLTHPEAAATGGLPTGAENYLLKPFAFSDFLAK